MDETFWGVLVYVPLARVGWPVVLWMHISQQLRKIRAGNSKIYDYRCWIEVCANDGRLGLKAR